MRRLHLFVTIELDLPKQTQRLELSTLQNNFAFVGQTSGSNVSLFCVHICCWEFNINILSIITYLMLHIFSDIFLLVKINLFQINRKSTNKRQSFVMSWILFIVCSFLLRFNIIFVVVSSHKKEEVTCWGGKLYMYKKKWKGGNVRKICPFFENLEVRSHFFPLNWRTQKVNSFGVFVGLLH